MWTLQLKSTSPTTQPNNIKRHNLLIFRWLRRASFSLRLRSKQQQQFLCRLSAAEDEILLFYLLDKGEKGGLDPTKPHIYHVTHILETKATSPCQRESRQHLQDASISQLFSHGAVHLPPWHSLDRDPISQTPGITGLWEILLDCIVWIFHFPPHLLLRFFIGVWSHRSSDW